MLFEGLTDREPYLYQLRNRIIDIWNLREMEYKPLFKEKGKFLIGIQKKPEGTLNLDLIINVEDLLVNFKGKESQLSTSLPGIQPQFVAVELEKMSMIEQVLFFMFEIDMYITTQGSASYYSFLMKPDSYVVYSPSCSPDSYQCSDQNISFQRALSHLTVVSILRYDKTMIECQNRNGAPREITIADNITGACRMILEKNKLLNLVVNTLLH